MTEEAAANRGSPPRWSLAALQAIHAAVIGGAGAAIPFRAWTTFALGCFALAALHAAVAGLAAAAHPRRVIGWRIQSFASVALLAVLTIALLRSGIYIATVYGALGRGVAAALAAGWALAVLFTVPLSCWGIAASGGIRWPRRGGPVALAVLSVAVGASLFQPFAAGRTVAAPTAGPLEPALAPAIGVWSTLPPPPDGAPSLLSRTPGVCASPPGPERATWVVTYLARLDGERGVARTRCIQADTAAGLGAALAAAIAEDGLRAPLVVDEIEAVQTLPALSPMLAALALRPGLDGVCLGVRCLMPWQLVADGQFGKFRPLPSVPDLRYGASPPALRSSLGDGGESIEGLARVVTRTMVLDRRGELHPLLRLRRSDPPDDAVHLDAAALAAEEFVLGAQVPDGRFLYSLDPFTGTASFEGFAVARQAGTTSALCELGKNDARVRSAAASSLKMLASLEWRRGDLGALVYPPSDVAQPIRLGPSALGLVALLSCRPRFGARFDELIVRLARFVLTMQRADGGFHPFLDPGSARPIPGPPPMYAEGEAVLALVLLDKEVARDRSSRLPRTEELSAAIDRSMNHFARDYWNHLERDLFFIEESWHCIAAREALGRHRNPGYEQFCLDYVAFKSRLVLDERSGVAPEFVGGLGFGNVVPPESTPTASFGEAVAAAIEVKRARGADVTAERATLGRMLRFLLRQQWDDASCFACAPSVRIPGAFSGEVASPLIRIDYVQHAWSAIERGARALATP